MSRSILDDPLNVPIPGMPHLTIRDYAYSAFTGRHPESQEMHRNLFGRPLALDPHSKKIIFEIPGLSAEEDIYRKPLTWPQLKEHQERRERESFELEMHQNKNPDPKLCRTCRTFKTVGENGLTNDMTIEWRPYGNFNQFILRQHCAFCRLVLYLIVCGKDSLHPRLAAIDRDVQGVQVHPQRLPSGEWFLSVEYAFRRMGAIRAVREDNYRTVVRQSHDSEADSAVALLQDERVIRGRQHVSTRVIVGWLDTCEYDHGETCKAEPRQGEDIRILLIDVVDKRLVSGSSTCRYLALSYVWGDVSMLRMLKSTLKKYSVAGSLDPQNPDIPKTISDAMYLVFALGERYLWIDSLCIVQDDTEQKHYYISRMDVIYSNAVATIVALSGKDANAGLPGIRPGSRRPQMIEHTATLSLVSTPPALNTFRIYRLGTPVPGLSRKNCFHGDVCISQTTTFTSSARQIPCQKRKEIFQPLKPLRRLPSLTLSSSANILHPRSIWATPRDGISRHTSHWWNCIRNGTCPTPLTFCTPFPAFLECCKSASKGEY